MGNSCYFNAVIQCLAHTPELSKAVMAGKPPLGDLPVTYVRLISRMLAENNSSVTIRPISLLQKVLNDPANDFRRFVQGDAHELLDFLINALHDACAKKVRISILGEPTSEFAHKEKESMLAFKREFEAKYSTVLNVFFGQLCNVIRSSDGVFEKNVFDTFSTLVLPVPPKASGVTLHDCLATFFDDAKLDGENRFFDDVRNTYVDAVKSHLLWKLPEIIVITLRRHNQQGALFSKNQTQVAIPAQLDVRKYTLRGHPGPFLYSLYAVCNHKGSADSGHCYAVCLRGDQWFAFDDDCVQKVDSPASRDNYILFYRRL